MRFFKTLRYFVASTFARVYKDKDGTRPCRSTDGP